MEKELKDQFRAMADRLYNRPVEHARLCANYINGYWRERGYDAECKYEDGRTVSNMVKGYPTKRLDVK